MFMVGSTGSALAILQEDRLEHLIFPKRKTAVMTRSNQQIMYLTDIRPSNPIRMPVQQC